MRRFTQGQKGGARIGRAKNTVAGDEPFRSGFNGIGRVRRADSTVNLNLERQAQALPALGELSNFVQRIRQKFLSAETWIDRHNENKIHDIQNFIECRNRCRGIEHNAGLRAFGLNEAQCAIQVRTNFLVDGNTIGCRRSRAPPGA